MSEAQVKATPSKAAILLAWELWHQIPAHYQSNPTQWQEAAAKVLDEEMSDLLEKAQTLNVYIEARWGDSDATIQGLNRPLAAALEPWKPKIITFLSLRSMKLYVACSKKLFISHS